MSKDVCHLWLHLLGLTNENLKNRLQYFCFVLLFKRLSAIYLSGKRMLSSETWQEQTGVRLVWVNTETACDTGCEVWMFGHKPVSEKFNLKATFLSFKSRLFGEWETNTRKTRVKRCYSISKKKKFIRTGNTKLFTQIYKCKTLKMFSHKYQIRSFIL